MINNQIVSVQDLEIKAKELDLQAKELINEAESIRTAIKVYSKYSASSTQSPLFEQAVSTKKITKSKAVEEILRKANRPLGYLEIQEALRDYGRNVKLDSLRSFICKEVKLDTVKTDRAHNAEGQFIYNANK